MHPDRRISDGGAGANGDLLRQVLTRNFLSVAYDPDEFSGHLRGASRFSYHSNDNSNIKSSNFIHKDFEASDDNEAKYSTSPYNASNSLTVLQTITPPATDGKILVPAELSVSHDNKNRATHAGQPRNSHGRPSQHNSKNGSDLCPNHQHQNLTDRVRDTQDTSCTANSLNSAGDSQFRFEDFSDVNVINIDESDFCYSRVKKIANKDSEKTESRGNFTDFQLSFPQSAPCTAFPFPSPKELYPSETTSCSKFNDEQDPTLKLHKAKSCTKDLANCDTSSEQEEEEDYDNQLSSSAEILSANLMPPPKGLPTSRDLHHLRQSTEVSHTADDDALAEAKDSFKHLASRRESFCKKSSNLRITSDSGVRRSIGSVSPKLVRRCDLIFGAVIGKGAFGKVHKGQLHGMPVAIKVVQKRRGSGIHREILQAERLAFSLKLRHENIVHILGVNVCDDLRGDALIVMELVSSRTLQCLLDDVTVVISPGERLCWGMEVTAALSYLHSHQLVHLDVKPKNVLVGEDVRCKLADFGNLTRTKPGLPREDTDYTQLLGTLPYRAPELMKGQFPSCKADIYSLGITLWQMASRETPHSGANPHWLIYQVTKANKRPVSHDTGDDALEMRYCELYRACWDAQPGSRPEAEDAHKALAELREVLWECGWREASYSCSRLG